MCGICGIVEFGGREIPRELLLAMRDVMTCRGPDDAGAWYSQPCEIASDSRACVALGHRRLSIIDLSPAGHQPMSNEDGTVWTVFNGEVYNFLELRPELEKLGHRFRSHTDTEVLIHGYEQWGIDGLVPRLRGMFAFALWDGRTQQLHLVRDHLGKKPMFYRVSGGRVEFASDIKALYLASPQTPELNPQAIDEFLYYGVISQNCTIFRGVHKLASGMYMSFRGTAAGGVQGTGHQYWRPNYTHKEDRSGSDWLAALDHHLRRAVKMRMISDVPLGGFLSGGVDSSTVCAIMAQEGTTRPRTFSVGFSTQDRFDEREYSRAVAEHIGSDHTELVVEPDVAPILSDLVWQYGEPYGDSSAVPTYLISREARKHVTVVLTGDGGDEGFAGYSRHLRADRARRYAWLTPLVTRGLAPLAAGLVNAIAPQTLFARNLDMAAKYLSGSPLALAGDTTWFEGLRSSLYSDSFRSRLGGFHPLDNQRPILDALGGTTHVDRALEHLLLTTLPNDYLTKVDVATMAHSLEARCPLLDVDLLDFAARIPSALLVEGNQAKSLLKRYAATLVPPSVIYRKKHGFAVPIRHWFRDEWRQSVRNILLSKQADRGYFNRRCIERILDAHAAGRANHASRIWTLLVLEIWHRLFVDKTLKPGEPVLAR